MLRKEFLAAISGLLIMSIGAAFAQDGASNNLSDGYVKVGVLTDMSGVYSADNGPGSVLAAKMAIKDFGGEVLGEPIKFVAANHENKPAVGAAITRRWIDADHVDVIVGLVTSSIGLAAQRIASSKHTITINTGSGTTQLTGRQCTKYGIHYAYDTYSLPAGTATAIVKNGGDTWFFITADYAFGHSLQKNTTQVVKALGGKVVGSVEAPLGTTDFASYLIQAKNSGAEVIALANAGQDATNAIRQAHAFHITAGGQQLAALLLSILDIKALSLDVAQGLQFTAPWYWNLNDETRTWSQRFFKKHGAMPTYFQAAVYSAVLTYLKAVKQAGTDDSDAVRNVLGNMTINDMFAQGGHIEPNGLMVHDMYLFQVKSPKQSSGPWDLEKVVTKIPGEKAFIPLAKSKCPLLDQSS